MLSRIAAVLAVLLATYIYRSGHIVKHHIITLPDLPPAYFSGGNYTDHCTLITDPNPTDTISTCEDIAFWDHLDAEGTLARRLVLLGCDPNRKAWNTVMGPLRDPAPRAYFWLFDTDTQALQPVRLEGYPAQHDFHPLGLEAEPSRAGNPSALFIVNHAREQTTIEQLVLDPARPGIATYVRTLTSPAFVSPNAIALTSSTSFYVSNDHLMTRRLPSPLGKVLPVIESVGGLPLGWLAHVSVAPDGTFTHRVVARGIPFPNGVALSPGGNHVALASTTLGQVLFYDRDPATDDLTFSHGVRVPFLPDNLYYAEDGALVVTGHPHFPALVQVAANATGAFAPSWAVVLRPISDTMRVASEGDFAKRAYDLRAPLSASAIVPASLTHEVETLFQSDGSVFGSSSTTLVDSRTGIMYMSGLYERGMLVCRP
ncbi:hypothetical protein V8B97DRAFT_1870104 [Scleroderma yunnanense]